MLAATCRSSRNCITIEADRAAGIVICRDREGNAVRRNVRVKNRHHRDAKHIGFLDREFFLVGINHEHHVRNTAHIANTTKREFKLVALAGQLKDFLLGKAVGVTRKLLFHRLQTLDRV